MASRFEPLTKQHDRAGFRSASPALNTYLQQLARKDTERRVAASFLMVEESTPATIVGYYTLSAFTVEVAELPEEMQKKLPRYPRLPATLLGRLARDERFPGTGSLLVMDALARTLRQSVQVASLAVVAEAKDDLALAFYRKFGFAPLGSHPKPGLSGNGNHRAVDKSSRVARWCGSAGRFFVINGQLQRLRLSFWCKDSLAEMQEFSCTEGRQKWDKSRSTVRAYFVLLLPPIPLFYGGTLPATPAHFTLVNGRLHTASAAPPRKVARLPRNRHNPAERQSSARRCASPCIHLQKSQTSGDTSSSWTVKVRAN